MGGLCRFLINSDPKSVHGFLSSNFSDACHNLTEIVAALAFLDLPTESAEHGYKTIEGRTLEVKAASNMIIFKKEVKQCSGDIRTNILVAQRYVDWEIKGDEDEKIEEYLVNHIYEAQVIITNISTKSLNFNVLLQIPQGSLPVSDSPYQKSHSVSLNSYSTTKLSYLFYFPSPGKFSHFPANVLINSVVVARANFGTLTVVKEKSKISEEKYSEVLLSGNKELILTFLKDRPLASIKDFSWSNLYFLLKDRDFFEGVLALLRQQNRFEETIWSYAIYHNKDEKTISEYLNSLDYYKSRFGFYYDSKLLNVRPIDSGGWHRDYFPLVNPRAHKVVTNAFLSGAVGERPLILNLNFYATYKAFVYYLIQKVYWDTADKMNLTYYLLLQDRNLEAISIFSKIDPAQEIEKTGCLKLQYDYMAAYLDFYTGAPEYKIAKKIAAAYINYPVNSWRMLFLDIDQQLKEYEGKASTQEIDKTVEESKLLIKKEAIATEAQLSIELEGKEVLVDYTNIPQVQVKYYLIDLEILFSRTPFLTQNAEDFSFVQPDHTEVIQLDSKAREYKLAINQKYLTKNVVIEVVGSGIQRMVTYFSTSLKVHIYENYGELKVTDESGKQLPQVYVKVFGLKHEGGTMFYKDGYTDIRGRFDYVSLNASRLAKVQKFAIFIMSDTNGSLIRECPPPTTTKRSEETFAPTEQKYTERKKTERKYS